jgi:hypothetical protein
VYEGIEVLATLARIVDSGGATFEHRRGSTTPFIDHGEVPVLQEGVFVHGCV